MIPITKKSFWSLIIYTDRKYKEMLNKIKLGSKDRKEKLTQGDAARSTKHIDVGYPWGLSLAQEEKDPASPTAHPL